MSRENVFVSRYMVELAKLWVREDADHWHVIYNAVNGERFRSVTSQRPLDAPYILYVGLVGPHKNIELLIRAFSHLSVCNYPKLRLVLVGDFRAAKKNGAPTSYAQQLLNIMDQEGVRSRVVMPGPVEGESLEAFYRHAEICVIPSKLESFGVVPAEALHCGTPCIVSDIPVFHEIYGDAVMYCDPDSHKDLADKIMLMLDDSSIGYGLVKKAAKVLPRYRLRTIAERYARVLELACQPPC